MTDRQGFSSLGRRLLGRGRRSRRWAMALAAVLTGIAGALLAGGGTALQPRSAAAAGPFPAHYFAPYSDTGLNNPVNMTQTAQSVGVKFWTMAFIIGGGS